MIDGLKKFGGFLLLLLGVLKLVAVVYCLIDGDRDVDTLWYVKQSLFGIGFACLGCSIMRPESWKRITT